MHDDNLIIFDTTMRDGEQSPVAMRDRSITRHDASPRTCR